MPVYYGVVKNNAIFLPLKVPLREGMTVEVRIPSFSQNHPISGTEQQFKQKLLELGLLITENNFSKESVG